MIPVVGHIAVCGLQIPTMFSNYANVLYLCFQVQSQIFCRAPDTIVQEKVELLLEMPNTFQSSSHLGLSEYQRLLQFAREPDTRVHEVLPSYELATASRRWDLVARYVTDTWDLLRCCVVSKAFRKAFTPQLWGSPAVHFGYETGNKQGQNFYYINLYLRC